MDNNIDTQNLPAYGMDHPTIAPHDRIGPCLLPRNLAAKYLHFSTDTLDRLCRERTVAYYRIGRSVRFAQWDLMPLVCDEFVTAELLLMGNIDRVLTKAQLAAFLSVSTRTVEHLMRDRRLWHRKTGRMVRFLLRDVLVQLDKNFRVPTVE
ncbi:MAG: helix-turn-helix domain-containing protein [Verrucomicrobiota bacterium]|jgi:excisionase family DNA binding protein